MENIEKLDTFLENVDKITELVMDLKSSDDEVSKKAMEKADCFIAALEEPCRTKVNRTSINTTPSRQDSLNLQDSSAEAFMKIMEKDAEARRLKRMKREKVANALKDKGNEAYARGEYRTAVQFYTDGLAELRDMKPLYTNRAQAFIKLGQYQEAITDCEWALKCDERCEKAYLHMGKAYLALKEYNKSRTCFGKIVDIEPGRGKMIKGYLEQVDLEEEKDGQEASAMEEFDSGDANAQTVPHLLEKLSAPGRLPSYYRGGLEILTQALAGCSGQTLFRLNNGFSIIIGNDTLRSCLLQGSKASESRELRTSVLKLWRVVCQGNDENQKTLMSCPVSRESAVRLVAAEQAAVRRECLALLSLFSETPRGRRLAIDSLDVQTLTKNLMTCIVEQRQQKSAVNILEKFSHEKKFCKQLRAAFKDSVSTLFGTVLRNVGESGQHVLPLLIAAVDGLARDDIIRRSLARDPDCWQAFLHAIERCIACKYTDVLCPLLGLIVNTSTISSPVIGEYAVPICDCCVGLLRDGNEDVVARATRVLSTILPLSSEAIQRAIQENVVRTMHRLLKKSREQAATKYAMKTLAVCTATSHLAREELLTADKKLSVLRRLLAPSCDEMVSGNAALCLAHCLELQGTASRLLGTDIVPLLLRHAAADPKSAGVQRNAAVALGKLCRSEPRHVSKLRELHGFEILHSCMKLIT
ncbi:tetratricopeptide repeat protein 12 [Nelusetta ayraudi]|uniref:tetratricopeptide repeat protein 12 n=1 Tax=Nelusetta ayraudi TaxID=303726 RepID=UPI003F6F1D03